MSNRATEFYRGMQAVIENAIQRVTPFRARVHDTMDGKVQIQTLDGSDPLDEPFARLAGWALEPDDEVAVIELSGKPFVLGRIVRSADGEPVVIKASDDIAFQVAKPDGTSIFEVDTVSPSGVRLMNRIPLQGIAKDGVTVDWQVDADGDATFKSVTSGTYNSPQVYQRQDVQPVTTSTTNTVTYVEAQTLTCDLPEGTWSLFVIAFCDFKRNGAGLVDYRLTIDGTPTPNQNADCNPDAWTALMTHRASHEHTGTTNVKLEYKGAGASTTSARNFAMTVFAVRTA